MAARIFASVGVITLLCFSGCYGVTIGAVLGILAATDDGSSSPQSPPVITNLSLEPGCLGRPVDLERVVIRYCVIASSDEPTEVELNFRAERVGSPTSDVIEGFIDSSEATFGGCPDGTQHTVIWNAAADGFVGLHRVTLTATPFSDGVAGISAIILESLVGNDPPEVRNVRIVGGETQEQAVVIRFEIDDSSDDEVTLIRFSVSTDNGATFLEPSEVEDDLLAGSTSGVLPGAHDLTWNSEPTLGKTDLTEVVVGIAAEDCTGSVGDVALSAPFRVDNDSVPVATIGSGSFVLNPDVRGGIPVPFEIEDADDDRDAVRVVFQWRREDQSDFPELPTQRAELETRLEDAVERRRLQIASERPIVLSGEAIPLSAEEDPERLQLRLPELTSTASQLLSHTFAEVEIALIRDLETIREIPSLTPLSEPVAALALGECPTGLVIDHPNPGRWRLQRLEFGGDSPAVVVASDFGQATSFALDAERSEALVGVTANNLWWIVRVQLASGKRIFYRPTSGADVSGEMHALEWFGTDTAIATVGNSLVQLVFDTSDSGDGEAGGTTEVRDVLVVPRLRNLKSPRGLAIDPLRPHHVYVAEKEWRRDDGSGQVGRIARVDIRRRAVTSVNAGGRLLPRPSSIALEGNGARLLVVTDADADDALELCAVELASDRATSFEIFSGLPAKTRVTTGPADLRLLTTPESTQLLASGGIGQRRRITNFDGATQIVTLDRPVPTLFQPTPTGVPLGRWQIELRSELVRPAPLAFGVFVWDSSDVAGGGEVLIRATPYDRERGRSGESDVPRGVAPALDVLPQRFSSLTPSKVALADVDGDGDTDIVAANESTRDLAIYLQSSPRRYGLAGGSDCDREPDMTLGGCQRSETCPDACDAIDEPSSLVAHDLDDNGHVDLIVSDRSSHQISIFFQDADGEIGTPRTCGDPGPQLRLGSAASTNGPEFVTAGDLNGDGHLDVIVASTDFNAVAIFLQHGPRDFGRPASVGGNNQPDLVIDEAVLDSGLLRAPVALTITDLDDNGLLDIATANEDSDNVALFFQERSAVDGSLRFSGRELATPELVGPVFVVSADFNGDGRIDLATANGRSENIGIFLQSDTGVFGRPVGETTRPDLVFDATGGQEVRPSMLAASDIDLDGGIDLVVGLVGGRLSVFSQEDLTTALSIPAFEVSPRIILGQSEIGARATAALSDIDGDGLPDIAATTFRGVEVYHQTSRRSTGTPACDGDLGAPLDDTKIGSVPTVGEPESFAVADLDADGDLDVVVAANAFAGASLFLQASPGEFLQRDALPEGSGVESPFQPPVAGRAVIAHDVDANGRIDLILADSARDELSVLFQESATVGDLGALQRHALAGVEHATSLAVGDLNRDNLADVFAASPTADEVAIFVQTAPRVFAPAEFYNAGDVTDGIVDLETADVNRDGRLDVVVVSFSGDHVAVLLGETPDASSRFTPILIQDSAATQRPTSVSVADLDLDGRPDIAVASRDEGTLAVFSQRDTATFERSFFTELSGVGPVKVVARDLDLDGQPDLTTANVFVPANNLTVFLGRRPGRFPRRADLSVGGGEAVGGGPRGLEILDLDGDGDRDIIGLYTRRGEIQVFYGAR